MAVGTNYEFRYTLNGRASYECTETTLFSGRQPCPLGKRGERLRDEVGAMLARLYILQGEPQVVDLIEKPDVEIRLWAAGTGYGAKEAEGVILDMLREGNREGKAHAYTRMSGGVFVSIPDPEKLRLARDERTTPALQVEHFVPSRNVS